MHEQEACATAGLWCLLFFGASPDQLHQWADEDTPPNVILKQCAKKVGIDRIFEHDNLIYFLETTHDINEGEYLSLGYNGLVSQGYFQIDESLAHLLVVAENPQMRANISNFCANSLQSFQDTSKNCWNSAYNIVITRPYCTKSSPSLPTKIILFIFHV